MLCNPQNYPLLAQISQPSDVRLLEKEQLQLLNDQLREFLINSIAHCGGHFAAGF